MSLESDIALLSRVKLFSGFETDHLRLLAFGAEGRSFEEGTRIYREGAYSDCGYVIVSGEVELVSGPADKVRTRLGPGSLIGEMALIAETEHAATATALTRVQVLRIPRPLFRRMLEEYPPLALLLRDRIGSDVQDFLKRLDIVRAKLDHADELAARPPKN